MCCANCDATEGTEDKGVRKPKSFAEFIEGDLTQRIYERLQKLAARTAIRKEERITTLPPTPGETRPTYLEKGMLYLIEDESLTGGFDVFICTPTKPIEKLTIDDLSPVQLLDKYNRGELHIEWVSNVGFDELMQLITREFTKGGQRLILIEGAEHLFSRISLLDLKRSIQSLREGLSATGSIQMITINPTAIERNVLNLLRQHVDLVI
jgi:hypothetical protein